MIFLRTGYLFNHSNCSHPPFEVGYLFLCFMAVIHSLKCTVSFSFVVPIAVICCHSLSFVVTCCHSLYLVVILCNFLYHSLSLIVIHCTTRCHLMSLFAIRFRSLYHSLSLDVPFVCIFINDLYLKSFCKNEKLANLQIIN